MSANMELLSEGAKDRGKPYKILIVDDEPWVRDVFTDFCSLTDAVVVETAENGMDALKMIRGGQYDLVTVDLIMPEMSGMEVLSEIKRMAPQVPVMVITGNATDKLINQAGVMGACQVLYKPIQLDEFVNKLSRTLVGRK